LEESLKRITFAKNYHLTIKMKYSELHKKLKEAGCYIVRQGGNHPIWFSPITNLEFPTSRHESQEVKMGTLNSILKRAGLKK